MLHVPCRKLIVICLLSDHQYKKIPWRPLSSGVETVVSTASASLQPAVSSRLTAYVPAGHWAKCMHFYPVSFSGALPIALTFSDYLETALNCDSHIWLVNWVPSVFVICGWSKALKNYEVVLLHACLLFFSLMDCSVSHWIKLQLE